MSNIDDKQTAIDSLELGGHPAHAPYVDIRPDGIRIDGTLTISELRRVMAIIDPPMPPSTDEVEAVARQVYAEESFSKTDEVWCNLFWLTKFARAMLEQRPSRAPAAE